MNQPKAFHDLALRLGPILLPSLSRALHSFRSSNRDAIFIQNLPNSLDEAARCALSLLIACLLGEPFQYAQQNHGEIVARISPEPGMEQTNSSSGKARFGWHSDDSILDERFRTELILLAGHYNPSHALTHVSSIDKSLNWVSQSQFFELLKPAYELKMPVSFKSQSNLRRTGVPLLWFDGSRNLNVAFSEYGVSSESAAGSNAIEEFTKAVACNADSYDLQSGNMLIFKNNRVLHSRGPIKGQRTVFRVYIRSELRDLREVAGEKANVFDLEKILAVMATA